MKTIYLLVVFNLICIQLFSQTTGYVPFSKPVSPHAYEFLKYVEMPVNEYSGLAEISIPIYQIVTDKIKIPISLTYHVGGIRVAEEASWVGLGWDLQMGSIVQVVNDRDDLDEGGAVHKILPDYYDNSNYYYPFVFCERANYPWNWGPTPYCFTPSTGIDQIHPKSSYISFTDYTFPLNGSYDNRNTDFFNATSSNQLDQIDAEPDIFKANFFGHSFSFIKDFKTGDIKILDKKGYKVSFVPLANNTKGIKVIAPDGTIFEFNNLSDSKITASTTYKNGIRSGGGIEETLATRIFQISKITDIDGKEIIFNWNSTGTINELPGFNQTYRKIFPGNQEYYSLFYDRLYFNEDNSPGAGGYSVTANTPFEDNGFNYSNLQVVKSYLASIVFPLGTITFNKSSRLDISNDLRLDKVEIKNINQSLIKAVDFSYSYFVGHEIGMGYQKEINDGIHYKAVYHGKSSTELANRLKLDSIIFSGEPAYKFLYNEIQLPVKSSYAVDYWGYYNGKTTNISLIPNPLKFNLTNLGDNLNDRDAYENYAKAASLERIIYPTKGERYFVSELNSFLNPSSPTITTGNGLRIRETGVSEEGTISKVEKYTYEGGKLLTPMSLFVNYTFSQIQKNGLLEPTYMYQGPAWQINSGNFYISSNLGSGNIVGYDKVTKESKVNNNTINGKTIDYYYNNYDLVNQVSNFASNLVLPARKDETKFTNGLVYKTEIFKEGGNNSIRKKTYEYIPFAISEVFYGAKWSLDRHFGMKLVFGDNVMYFEYPQHIMGFYPIYSGTCLLYKETVTDSMTSDSPIVKRTFHYYDTKDNVSEIETDRSDGNSDVQYFCYPYSQEVLNEPYMSDLRIANRINHPIKIDKILYSNTFPVERLLSSIHESYGLFGNKVLLSKYSELFPDALPYKPNWENTTIIDKYDSFGNIQQYHKKDGVNSTILWGYKSQYPVAEIIGSDYATVSGIISNQNLLDNPPTDDNTLRTYLNTLRTNLPNAIVNTYTHSSLIGMSSQTDPKGMTTYYNYDSFNRLAQVLDNNNNILKDYTYHYYNQSAPQLNFSTTISLDQYTTPDQIGWCSITIRDAGTNAILFYKWKSWSFPYTASLPASSNGYYTVTIVPATYYPLEGFVNNVMKDVYSSQTWTQVSGNVSIILGSNFY